MRAHRTDLVSLGFGLLFLGLAAWWLLARLLGLALPPVGWFLAGALILIGVLGVVGALRSGRTAAKASGPDPAGPDTPDLDTPDLDTPGAGAPDPAYLEAADRPEYPGATGDPVLCTDEPPFRSASRPTSGPPADSGPAAAGPPGR